eukprot:TRINITY_DN16280_c0_g1_i1.p1 TRINITY_DN16280_c0_g1~~TRINITY_DN16280_c0_g1_i1.p1  ORF type:complete len:355 (+),score=73.60 TRINITY_DN16280_c0_g1_i1:59-1123(+)
MDDWIAWRDKEECRLAALDVPDTKLVVNTKCVNELKKFASAVEPSKVVTIIGDQGVGKSTLVAELLRDPVTRKMGSIDAGDTEAHRTTGVRVYTMKAAYKYLVIDTEGLNSPTPPNGVGQEEYNSYYRPGLQQLIPHLVYQLSNVVVFVWGPETQGSSVPHMEQAYRACVSAFHVTSGGTPVNRSRSTVKPVLLLLLNKIPLRKCFSAEKDDVQYVTERWCSDAVQELDLRNGGCLGNFFSSLHAFMLPLKASKWRPRKGPDVLGGPVFSTSIVTLQGLIHTLLTEQMRSMLDTQPVRPRALLSEAAWVTSLAPRVHAINTTFHRWGCPVFITTDDIRSYTRNASREGTEDAKD